MFTYYLEETKDGKIKISYKPAHLWLKTHPLSAALATEHAMALTISLSGFLTGKIIKPQLTTFCHKVENKDLKLFKDYFGDVLFGNEENSLTFDISTAQSPVISSNNLVYENMLQICHEKMTALINQASVSTGSCISIRF